jgi:hypothetical protein
MWTTCAGAGFGGRHRQDLGGFRSLPARRTLVRRRRRIAPTKLSDPAPEDRTRVKTGENSMPTNGEDSPPAHVHYFCVRPVLNTRSGVSGNPSSRDCERPARMGQLNGTVLGGCADALSRHTSCSATSRRLVDTLSMSQSAAPAHRIIPLSWGDSSPRLAQANSSLSALGHRREVMPWNNGAS